MFKFSLQSVLQVRERLEKIKYKEYSTVLQQQRGMEEEIERRQNHLARAGRHSDEQRLQGRLPLQLHDQFRRRMHAEIDVLETQVREQQQELEARRKELVEARRAHRALEILRDREQARFEQEEARRERAIMDEVASNYHGFAG